MVIVNIKVPTLEKEYNFSLDEKEPVKELIEEIVDLILQKEGIAFSKERWESELPEMALCAVDAQVLCDRSSSLSEYGVSNGAELVLV